MSAMNKPSDFEFSRVRAELEKFFKKELDALGLSMNALKRQNEEALRRSLKIVTHAIENHESFGKFGIRMTMESGAVITRSKAGALFEAGISPLLLERYQLILQRLEEFEKRKKISVDESKPIIIKRQKVLTKFARGEINRRLWIVIAAMIILWIAMFFLIQIFGWNLLEPWTYLLGIGLVIGGYAYFAIQQREFSPLTMYQQAFEARKKQLFETFGIEDE